MRFSLVLLLCLAIVVVNSATTKTTRRRLVVTTGRGTTKAPTPKSAYAYLRTVRGKHSCAGGACPFWERHGRSFAALRCYSRQYQECTCLHRMCFSSCMFSREICNQEMVSCLQQICPRCMPTSASAMCAVYDSMAQRVAEALSVFACYPCCPNLNSISTNNSSGGSTTTPVFSEGSTTVPFGITDDLSSPSITETFQNGDYYPAGENQPSTNVVPGTNQNTGSFPSNNVNNGVYTNGNSNVYSNGNSNVYSNGNTNSYSNTNSNTFSNGNNNGFSNTNSNANGNGIPNTNNNANGNGIPNTNSNANGNGIPNTNSNVNGNGIPNTNSNANGNGIPNTNSNTNGNGVPNTNVNSNGNLNSNGNGNPNGNVNSATSGNGISNGNGNGNSGNCNAANNYPGVVFPGSDAMFYNNHFPHRNQQNIKQRGRQTVSTTKRRVTTTGRTAVTTRRLAQASATVRGNNVKKGVRKPVSAATKPQTNNRVKS